MITFGFSSTRFRRSFAVLLVVVSMIGVGPWAYRVFSGEKIAVYVYLQTSLKPRELKEEFSRLFPQTEVKVFGRVRDFSETVTNSAPDVVLACPEVLHSLGLQPTIHGWRNGKREEPMVLMSVDRSLSAVELSGLRVGVVDILGRKKIHLLVKNWLHQTPVVVRTTKTEDLLALLQLSSVDAVLLPQSQVRSLQDRSRLTLLTSPVPGASIGLPAASVMGAEAKRRVVRGLGRMDKQLMRLLGVDTWQ